MLKAQQAEQARAACSAQSADRELLRRIIEKNIQQGYEAEAMSLFEGIDVSAIGAGEESLQWGRVAEHCGRRDTARMLYEKALTCTDTEVRACVCLVRLYLEQGDTDTAGSLFEKARSKGMAPELVDELSGEMYCAVQNMEEPDDFLPIRDDGQRLAQRMCRLFRGKKGAYARQWYDRRNGRSGYVPVSENLSARVIRKHLDGIMTVGVYPLREDGTVCFSAIDIDVEKNSREKMKRDPAHRSYLAGQFKKIIAAVDGWSMEHNLHVLFEQSGYKGIHAWYFFENPVPAGFARSLLMKAADALGELPEGLSCELFPRQVTAGGKGYGNLIKLPLGIHRKTGKKSVLLDNAGKPLDNQARALFEARINSHDTMQHHFTAWLQEEETKKIAPLHSAGSRQVDESHRMQPHTDNVSSSCAMIGYLVRKAADEKHLAFQERKILLGVYGHVEGGRDIIHRILSCCSDYSESITSHYIDKLKGTPVGCKKIQRTLYYLNGVVSCDCTFGGDASPYPTPLLHAQKGIKQEVDKKISAQTCGDDDLFRRIDSLQQEVAELKRMVRRKSSIL